MSDAEWALVIELLEREQHDLPTEIRHTRVTSFRDELRQRSALVNDLLQRLQAQKQTA
jgi:hypothetical protein